MIKSILFFLLAGLAEIGGGYLVWLWLREGRPLWYGLLGGAVLIAYGGIFIALSLLWGWLVDKKAPDLYDWLGALVCLVGVAIIMWAPRR